MIALAVTLKAWRLQLIAEAINGGKLLLYPLPQPAAGGTHTCPLLAEINLPSPAASVAISGLTAILTFAAVADVQAVVDGDAAWGRFVDSGGAFVLDGVAGVTGSGADILMADTHLIIGGFVRIISGTLDE